MDMGLDGVDLGFHTNPVKGEEDQHLLDASCTQHLKSRFKNVTANISPILFSILLPIAIPLI